MKRFLLAATFFVLVGIYLIISNDCDINSLSDGQFLELNQGDRGCYIESIQKKFPIGSDLEYVLKRLGKGGKSESEDYMDIIYSYGPGYELILTFKKDTKKLTESRIHVM